MSEITIPPEAIDAAARTFTPHWDGSDPGWQDAIRDKVEVALRAGIAAWPGVWVEGYATPHLILPLPTEARDE